MVSDKNVRSLFQQMSDIESNGTSVASVMSGSDKPMDERPDFVRPHGYKSTQIFSANSVEVAQSPATFRSAGANRGSRDEHSGQAPRQFCRKNAWEPDNSLADMQPLTPEELYMLRLQLREQAYQAPYPDPPVKRAKTAKEFKMPKEHPVFEGKLNNLELFFVEMQLVHLSIHRGIWNKSITRSSLPSSNPLSNMR